MSESVLPRVWGSRLDRLADMVTEADVDLVCLQEVWFRAEFLEVLERRLGEFWMATARRTGGKEDGVATLWRKGISAIGAAEVDLQGGGDRVARLDLLQLGIRRVVLLVNVHLTFLHSNEEVPMRKMQVEQLIREIDRFISK